MYVFASGRSFAPGHRRSMWTETLRNERNTETTLSVENLTHDLTPISLHTPGRKKFSIFRTLLGCSPPRNCACTSEIKQLKSLTSTIRSVLESADCLQTEAHNFRQLSLEVLFNLRRRLRPIRRGRPTAAARDLLGIETLDYNLMMCRTSHANWLSSKACASRLR